MDSASISVNGSGGVLSDTVCLCSKVNFPNLDNWLHNITATLENAANASVNCSPNVSIAVRAVQFGDLLTIRRASGGGPGVTVMAST